MRLTFLGSGDAFGSGGRMQACLLLHGGPEPMLLDCGATALVAMKRAGVDPNEIGTVALSHLHGDHFGGLPFMILDGQFTRRTRPLLIAGPPGTQARVEAAMEVFFLGSTRVTRRFETRFEELMPQHATEIGPATITPYPVVHESGAPSYALRVEYANKMLAYSGDTEWTDTLLEATRNTDALVCEAYAFEKKIRYHLDHESLKANAEALATKRIILTHMSQDMLTKQTDSPYEKAEDGKEVEL